MTRVFLNVLAATPEQAAVAAHNSLIPIAFRPVIRGNVIAYRIFLVDGTGGFDAGSGDDTYTVRLAVGDLSTGQILASHDTWTTGAESIGGITAGYWEAQLDLTGSTVTDYLETERNKLVGWELEVSTPDGEVRTYAQQEVLLFNRLNT